MIENVTITKDNGETLAVNLVNAFSVPEIQKDFVITTTNEIDPNGLVILNVSQLAGGKLIKVESEDDWGKIKNIMRSIISSTAGNFKYVYGTTTVSSGVDFARNISVQVVAKDQLVKDYYEKKPAGNSDVVVSDLPQPIVDIPTNPAVSGAMPGIGESEVAQGIVEIAPTVSDVTPEVPSAVVPEVAPVVTPEIAPIVASEVAPVVVSEAQEVVPAAPVGLADPSIAPITPPPVDVVPSVTMPEPVVAPVVSPVVESPVVPVSDLNVTTTSSSNILDLEKEFIESARKLVAAMVEEKLREINKQA